MTKRTRDHRESEEGAEADSTAVAAKPRVLTLRLLRNCYVKGVLGKKGQTYEFSWEEAQKRLAKTSGIWETV